MCPLAVLVILGGDTDASTSVTEEEFSLRTVAQGFNLIFEQAFSSSNVLPCVGFGVVEAEPCGSCHGDATCIGVDGDVKDAFAYRAFYWTVLLPLLAIPDDNALIVCSDPDALLFILCDGVAVCRWREALHLAHVLPLL